MRENVPELLFPIRSEFRKWLQENAKTSEGVWILFGKSKRVVTLTANEALEEALCFGWIDGQMKRIDDTKYKKYFARRRLKSKWSGKNKSLVKKLIENGMMTESGIEAIENAKKNGMWNLEPIGDKHIEALAEMLKPYTGAYDQFKKLTPYSRLDTTKWYYSFKRETTRRRELLKIIDRLNQMKNK